jgi:hypothetical protein
MTRAKGVGAWLSGERDRDPRRYRVKIIDVDMCINRHIGYDSPETLIRRGVVAVWPRWLKWG